MRQKRNFLVSPDLYNAALTGGDLVEPTAVLELQRDNLITDGGLCIWFEGINKPNRNLRRNEAECARSALTN